MAIRIATFNLSPPRLAGGGPCTLCPHPIAPARDGVIDL
jgi:hypothetical protein